MAIIKSYSTPDAFTPVCSFCGISSGLDISLQEYKGREDFFDGWCCKFCSPTYDKKSQKKDLTIDIRNVG